MSESVDRKSGQSIVLLIGISLTLLAVFAHRFLPERRLTLDSARPGATYFLMQASDGAPAQAEWLDQARFHFACKFPATSSNPTCSFTYLLYTTNANQGIDLSRYHTMNLAVRYAGNARYLRVAVRHFDPRFSRLEDTNSSKFNSINLDAKDLAQPLAIRLSEFTVPEWWAGTYNLPRDQRAPDLGNATAISFDLLGDLAGTSHDIQIEKLEFTGDWISAEAWYLGIISIWMILAATFGVTQLVRLRRQHREQSRQIDELEKLSTQDALTKVLNRHGIERFVEAVRSSGTHASVIVVDLDHFKRVNDGRGHHAGDRVLRSIGEILATHVRHTDGVGRWGGEEFVLVCPGASLSKAADLAEKLRLRIMATNFIPEDPLRMTASFGVASANADRSFEDAFRQADEALYLAKSRGRNCVVAAAEDQMHKITGARKGTLALISGRFKLHK